MSPSHRPGVAVRHSRESREVQSRANTCFALAHAHAQVQSMDTRTVCVGTRTGDGVGQIARRRRCRRHFRRVGPVDVLTNKQPLKKVSVVKRQPPSDVRVTCRSFFFAVALTLVTNINDFVPHALHRVDIPRSRFLSHRPTSPGYGNYSWRHARRHRDVTPRRGAPKILPPIISLDG